MAFAFWDVYEGFSLILHSENRYFPSFNFSPFLASFLKGCVPMFRGPAQFTILRHFEMHRLAIRTSMVLVWSSLSMGNWTTRHDLVLLFPQLLQTGGRCHLLQDSTLFWAVSSSCLSVLTGSVGNSPDLSLYHLDVGPTFSSLAVRFFLHISLFSSLL